MCRNTNHPGKTLAVPPTIGSSKVSCKGRQKSHAIFLYSQREILWRRKARAAREDRGEYLRRPIVIVQQPA
jgi:hypothetical protein